MVAPRKHWQSQWHSRARKSPKSASLIAPLLTASLESMAGDPHNPCRPIPASLQEAVVQRFAKKGFEHQAALVFPYILPAVALDVASEPCGSVPVGRSRLRGIPDVPADWNWPEFSGEPLDFLAQFWLSEFREFAGAELLPADGTLSFFYPVDRPFSPSRPDEQGALSVYFFPAYQEVAPATDLPTCLRDSPTWLITASQGWSFPLDRSYRPARDLYEAVPSLDEGALIDCEFGLNPTAGVQFLGYPSREQESDLQLECELLSRGFDLRRDPHDVPVDADSAAAEWMVLVQFQHSDRRICPHFEDGYLHFWIRRDHLARADFSQVWFQWCVS